MATPTPALPYPDDALEPQLSAAAIGHHRQHQLALVQALDDLVRDTPFQTLPLPEIIRQASGPLYSTAAEVWNHDFFWRCLRPPGTHAGDGPEDGPLRSAIDAAFGGNTGLREQFFALARSLPGSGWLWLVQRRSGALGLLACRDAGNPLTGTDVPLLACDLWEHAWMTDYPGDRDAWLQAFWCLIDWPAVAGRLA